jgi:hypothetical protein
MRRARLDASRGEHERTTFSTSGFPSLAEPAIVPLVTARLTPAGAAGYEET